MQVPNPGTGGRRKLLQSRQLLLVELERLSGSDDGSKHLLAVKPLDAEMYPGLPL